MKVILGVVVLACGCPATAPESQCADSFVVGFDRDAFLAPPTVVAVGGRYRAQPLCPTAGMVIVDLDQPFEVDDHGGPVHATRDAEGIVLSAEQAGTSHVRIHGDGFDQTVEMSAGVVDHVELITDPEGDGEADQDDGPYAWAPGPHRFSLEISGAGAVLRDDTATATGPTIADFVATPTDPGDLAIAVHAGTFDTTISVPVTSQADTIVLKDPQTSLPAGRATSLCFAAYSEQRRVLDLPWAFTLDGVATAGSRNCGYATPSVGATTAAVTGAAGGASLTVTLPVTP